MMKKNILAGFLSLIAFVCLQAQPVNVSSPKAMRKAAEEAEAQGNLYTALEYYDKVYDSDKEKATYVKIAELHYVLRDYERAEKALARIVTRDRKREWGEYRFLYAQCLKLNGKYDEAIEQFEQYALSGKDDKKVLVCKSEVEACKAARKMKQPDNLLVNNLGKNVNSPQTEASPVLDEGNLYFTSLASKEVITLDGKEGDYYAKIFTTAKEGEAFGKPVALAETINREGYHQGNVSITPDGKVMYFTRVQMEGAQVGESKIFFSRRNGQDWGAAAEVAGVNGDYIAKHPALGELFGEKVLFFTSNMPGGKGGEDLYYATRKEDGIYSVPVNLGDKINTPGDEVTPFYRDGKLYFSSNGHASMGGLDVFESSWNGSTWSAPANLGKGVNSSVDDFFFTSNGDGKQGFVVSNRPGINSLKSKTCCDDIYSWEYEKIKVNLTASTFSRKKKNEKENPELKGCTVYLYDVSNKSPQKVDTRTNAEGNSFSFTLAPEKEYMIIGIRDGYDADTATVNTVGVTKSKDMSKTLVLRTEKKLPPPPPAEPDSVTYTTNEAIRLNNIYYDFDDDKILADAEADLSVLFGIMNQYKDMVIELSSHTDARGNDKYNAELSQRRAESAKRWLVAKGIAAERIQAKGYGESVILNGCTNGVKCDDDQHRFNRRTEFKILSGPTTITIKRTELRSKQKAGGKQSYSDLIETLLDLYDHRADTLAPDTSEKQVVWVNPADAIVKFTEKVFLLNGVKEGDQVPYSFIFTNHGQEDLEIDLVSACDCIRTNWTHEPIKQGETGRIDIVFQSAGQLGKVEKDIDILFKNVDKDGYPLISRAYIKGYVNNQ